MRYAPLLYLLICFFSNCSQPKAPTFIGVESFHVDHIGSKETAVSAALLFYNPNPFPVNIKTGEADFLIENQLLGHSFIQHPLQVAARDSFRVPLQLMVDSKKIMSNTITFLLKKEVLVEIRGQAKIERSGIPIKVPIYYKGLQALQW